MHLWEKSIRKAEVGTKIANETANALKIYTIQLRTRKENINE